MTIEQRARDIAQSLKADCVDCLNAPTGRYRCSAGWVKSQFIEKCFDFNPRPNSLSWGRNKTIAQELRSIRALIEEQKP